MKYFARTGFLIAAAFWAVVIFQACSGMSYTDTAYRSLETAAVIYDTAMTAAGDLYRQGIISEAEKAEIVSAGKKFHTAYLGAVAALEAYKQTGAAEDKDRVEVALTAFQEASAIIMALIRPYILVPAERI